MSDPDDDVNSRAYWDGRFGRDWESAHGPAQSRGFTEIALANLPGWLLDAVIAERLSVVDWGCAQGDGTAAWADHCSPAMLSGVDFSAVAVAQAAARYPALRFLAEDWLDGAGAGAVERHDVVFSSNTLEHFADPDRVLAALAARTRRALCLLLPFREEHRHPEHMVTFTPDNVPVSLPGGLTLVWSRVVDCGAMASTPWPGEQIVLVYADPAWVHTLAPTLAGVEIGQRDVRAEESRLRAAIAAHEDRAATLATERDAAVAYARRLEEVVADHERAAARTGAWTRTLESRVELLEQRHARQLTTRAYRLGRVLSGKLRGR
ncbi:MAG: class I SAM-dependent methyltransferase [Kofleriaceae bacterium]|nr:class I SAM-dependent methyltransferase [Kofleriaceae bacterium]